MLSLLEFVATCRAETTMKAYRLALASYIENVYSLERKTYQRSPDHMAEIDTISRRYLTEPRDPADDLLKFVLAHKHLSPKALRVRVEAVKLWLEYNEIELPKHKLKRVLSILPRARALTQDTDLSVDIIRPLYENMSLPGRAMVLMLMSSGMRIGELLSITLSDIDLDANPIEINIQAEFTKIKEPRYTFVSTETGIVLREWLKNRQSWIEAMQNRGGVLGMKKDLNDPRIFPFGSATVARMLIRGLQKAGLHVEDERTGRSKITAHSFRKFFLSQLKTAMPPEQVELLAGHSGYLSDSYRRYPKEQVRASYLAAEYAVSLSGMDVQISRDLESQREAVRVLTSDNIRKTQSLESLRKQMEDMAERVDQISSSASQLDGALISLPEDVKMAILQAAAEKMK